MLLRLYPIREENGNYNSLSEEHVRNSKTSRCSYLNLRLLILEDNFTAIYKCFSDNPELFGSVHNCVYFAANTLQNLGYVGHATSEKLPEQS